MNNFESTAKSDRIKAESRDICPACEQTLWITFLFDAFGHHKDEDGDNISNIGKLTIATKDIVDKGIRRYYYPGLGKHFNPEATVLAAMAVKNITEETKKAEVGIAKEAATSTAKVIAKEVWEHEEGWWQRIEKTAVKDSKELYHKYKSQYRIVFNKTERDRYLRGISRYWKNFVEDLIYHPGRSFNIVKRELAKIVAGHASEQISFVRDAAWVAMLFNTGVDTRLEAAARHFREAVATSKKLTKIKHINVAIFGADMGGALAIAFANKLLKDICAKGQYDGMDVHIRFMGLFDCVSARYDDNFLTGFVPLANSVSGELTLPKKVERVVHFAAAHENRLHKPLSSIGGGNKPGERLEEKLFPGAQQDVTGGYGNDEQGIDNQLSRMPLRMMLGRAWRYGVPVYTLEKMEQGKTDYILQIAPFFKMDPKLSDQVYAYWNKVKELSTIVQPPPKDMPVYGHTLESFSNTGRACAPPVVHPSMKIIPEDIKGLLPAHMALYIAWLKHQYNIPINTGHETVARHQRLLNNELKQMKRRSGINPLDPASLSKEEQEMWKIWQGNSASTLGDLTPLFEKHIHDSMAESMLEEAWGDFVQSRHYFNYRHITLIEQEPDKEFFETLWDKAVETTKSAEKI